MSLIIGLIIGVTLGIIPGGNPVISAWLSDFLPIEGKITSVITTFIVSGVKLSNPQTSGDLNGMISEACSQEEERSNSPSSGVSEEVDVKKIAIERLFYFLGSFICALPILTIRQGINTFFFPSVVILAMGIGLYICPPFNLMLRRSKLPYLIYSYLLIIVGVGSLGMFYLAQIMSIANPIYIVSISMFFPWERIFKWGLRATKPKSNMNEPINPGDLFISTGLTFGMGGWNAPLTGYSLDLFEKKKVENYPRDRVKRSLFIEAIAEGIRLGSVLYGIDRLESRSAITQSIKEGVDIAFIDYRWEIILAVIGASLMLFLLVESPFPDIYAKYAKSKSANLLFYGIMAGTVFGSGGIKALPILGIGIIVNYLTTSRMLWASDPKAGNRARSTVFIYPILFF